LVEDEELEKESAEWFITDGLQCQSMFTGGYSGVDQASADYDTQYGTFIRFSFLR